MTILYVDADACPVKDEIYRVARRNALKVYVVANAVLQIPQDAAIECIVVGTAFDAADNWIAEHAGPHDIVITTDLPLTDRAIKRGARTLTPKGFEHTPETIPGALASRALMEGLRQMGTMTGGPSPFGPRDRSKFLSELERVIQSARRAKASSAL